MLWLIACGAPELEFVERAPDAADATVPLVVALHGYGDVPESMVALTESCALDARIVAPRGPKKHPSGEGAAWYLVDAGDAARDPGPALNAADQVARFIQSYTGRRPTSKVIVTGFSQGGILSFALATRYPKLIDASVPVAGTVPEVVPPKAGAPTIRALHGEADTLFPPQPTADRVEALRVAGWDATIERFPGAGHEISAPIRDAWCRDLREAVEAR